MTTPSRPDQGPEAAGVSDGTTLTTVLDAYRTVGFGATFWAEEGATVRCGTCTSVVPARRLVMHSLRRLEGASDPADMLAVLATSCPACHARGTMVLAYGPMASEVDAAVLLAVEDRRHDDVLADGIAPGESRRED